MPYFDPAGDVNLIPKDLRSSNRLAEVSAQAERDVIASYTKVSADPDGVEVDAALSLRVLLRGYAVDPTQANAHLRQALKDTVAAVASWRLFTEKADPSIESESTQDGKHRKYRMGADKAFPRDWDRRLRSFDIRAVPYSI